MLAKKLASTIPAARLSAQSHHSGISSTSRIGFGDEEDENNNNNSIGFSDLEEEERNDRFDYESEEDKNMVRKRFVPYKA